MEIDTHVLRRKFRSSPACVPLKWWLFYTFKGNYPLNGRIFFVTLITPDEGQTKIF